MAKVIKLNPERMAYLEAAGWRAYYNRRWIKLLLLIVALCQEQFKIPFPMSLLAAYYITRASILWVPVNHDLEKVLFNLEQFYKIAQCYSGVDFDPVKAAALELRYFDVHRRLAGTDDKTEFVQTLIKLHSTLLNLPENEVRESARLRVRAADTVDLITGGKSTNVESDWVKLETDLRLCYTSLQHALNRCQNHTILNKEQA